MNNLITTISRERLVDIIEISSEVISALAGTNEDLHKDNSTKMCQAWDDLNDTSAPPDVVREMARALLAVMDAKPVAEITHDGPMNFCHWFKPVRELPDGCKLFTTPPAPSAPECEWTYDESDYFWSSSCGEDWQFTDGGPVENSVKFCQGCGGKLKLAAAPAPGGDDV